MYVGTLSNDPGEQCNFGLCEVNFISYPKIKKISYVMYWMC